MPCCVSLNLVTAYNYFCLLSRETPYPNHYVCVLSKTYKVFLLTCFGFNKDIFSLVFRTALSIGQYNLYSSSFFSLGNFFCVSTHKSLSINYTLQTEYSSNTIL